MAIQYFGPDRYRDAAIANHKKIFAGQMGAGDGGSVGSGRVDVANIGQNGATLQDTLSDIMGMGGGARQRINADFNTLQGTTAARLQARGLGNSTLLGNMRMGVEGNRQQAMLDLQDKLLGQSVGARQYYAGLGNQQTLANIGANASMRNASTSAAAQLAAAAMNNASQQQIARMQNPDPFMLNPNYQSEIGRVANSPMTMGWGTTNTRADALGQVPYYIMNPAARR